MREYDVCVKLMMSSVRYVHTQHFMQETFAFVQNFNKLQDILGRSRALASGKKVSAVCTVSVQCLMWHYWTTVVLKLTCIYNIFIRIKCHPFVHPSLRPSIHKKFYHLNEIWYVIGCTRWYAVWPDPSSRSRSWRSESCEKWFISKSTSSTNIDVIKRLMVNYDTPRQYLNVYHTDFW